MMPGFEQFVEVMLRHLPPSAAELRLLDVGGGVSRVMVRHRPDIEPERVSLMPEDWDRGPDPVDAVVAYDLALDSPLLAAVLEVLRPGGRFIVVQPAGKVSEVPGRVLENAGYTRILIEPAVDGVGVLIRGERPHETADTLARVQIAAGRDAEALDLDHYRGRFVHLLIRQSPNIPVWRLKPDEELRWEAAALRDAQGLKLLAFSSLPRAVSFMQPAVVAGKVRDIHKVVKFSRETARDWQHPALINSALDVLDSGELVFIPIDPDTAEAPDE